MTKPSNERCEDCKYEVAGRCHYGPPQFAAIVSTGAGHTATWPDVAPDDWCGQYKPGAVTKPGPEGSTYPLPQEGARGRSK